MKKFFISAFAVMASLAMSAQVFTTGDITRVNLTSPIDQPVISADGSFVVAQSNAGLSKIDLASGAAQTIAEGQGLYNVAISPDGNNVVYTRPSFDKNHLRYTTLESVNLASGQAQTIVKASRNMAHGVTVTNNAVNALNNGKAAVKALPGAKSEKAATVAIDRGHLAVTIDGKTTNIDPQGRASYLWPSISPDGQHIVYWCVYRGCFVCDLDGSNARPMGGIRAAVWAGNDAVIGMVETEGQAQRVTASELVAVSLDGKRQTLTDSSVIAMFPSASADGSRVAFTDLDGALYILNLSK